MRKIILITLLLSGCSTLTTEPVLTVEQRQAIAQALAQLYTNDNVILKCINDAGNDFKKVGPCMRRTPTPTPVPTVAK